MVMVDSKCEQLTADIAAAGLGPVELVETIRPTPGAPEVIRVILDSTNPRLGRLLQRWLTLMTVQDMVMGQFSAWDRAVRLNLRGVLPSGQRVILVAPFDDLLDRRKSRVIADAMAGQQVQELVDRLAEMEEQDGA